MRYDERTALLVVDVQNDFADPEGSLYVAGGEAVVPFVNDQIAIEGIHLSLCKMYDDILHNLIRVLRKFPPLC